LYSLYALTCVIAGGLLEPAWVIAMKKSDGFHRPLWTVLAVILIVASPYCMSLSLDEIPVGTAYAIWTGIGSLCTVLVGALLFHEKTDLKQCAFLSMIIIGVVGLSFYGGSA